MNLFILRHGPAEPCVTPGIDDATRVLTAEGRKRVKQIAVAMQTMGLTFDLILSSPYPRAKQTAEIVADRLKLAKRLQPADELAPDGRLRELFAQLARHKPAPKNLLIVGHEPCLSQLIGVLISGKANAEIELKKGGLAKLAVKKLRFGQCATLEWLLTPAQLKKLR